MSDSASWWGVAVSALAAGATIWAVIVALKTSRDAAVLAKALRNDERKVELSREQALRRQLAIAFDQEMYMMIGQVRFFDAKVLEAYQKKDSSLAYSALRQCAPTQGLVLLERFADHFPIFPIEAGANLLGVLGTWIAFKQSPETEFTDAVQLWIAVEHVGKSNEGFLDQMEFCRRELRDFVPDNIKLPPLDEHPPLYMPPVDE